MAESSFAEKVNMDNARNYMEEYSTDVMTGGRNERMSYIISWCKVCKRQKVSILLFLF